MKNEQEIRIHEISTTDNKLYEISHGELIIASIGFCLFQERIETLSEGSKYEKEIKHLFANVKSTKKK